MKCRPYNRDTDYETLVEWWKQWEFGVVPKDMLPVDGIMVVDEKPICFGGIYFLGPNTSLALMEWVVTDKNSDLKTRHKALKMCINSVMDLARNKGIKLVYTMTKEKALQKRYVKYHNMVQTESGIKSFICDLDGKSSGDLTWISDDEQIKKHNK
tara:strand:- start:619 stop:1083 length:465 start_codon:yes stop_codon:yes gene_type:complete